MTQTLRRELRTKFEDVLVNFSDKLTIAERESTAELLADAALELRAFSFQTENHGLDWKLGHGVEVTQEDADEAKTADEAPKMFEKALGFGSLPWGQGGDWDKLRKFITEIYIRDRWAFGNFNLWRSNEGRYTAMSNKQIRMNPQMFIDTGWAEFENSNKKKTDEEQPAYNPPIERTGVPRPAHIPAPRIGNRK